MGRRHGYSVVVKLWLRRETGSLQGAEGRLLGGGSTLGSSLKVGLEALVNQVISEQNTAQGSP